MQKLEKCPVIVRNGCAEHREQDGTDRPAIWHPSENRCELSFSGAEGECWESYVRCDEPLGFRTWKGDESGATYVEAGCWEGHVLGEIMRDINLDLDGVPLNA